MSEVSACFDKITFSDYHALRWYFTMNNINDRCQLSKGDGKVLHRSLVVFRVSVIGNVKLVSLHRMIKLANVSVS